MVERTDGIRGIIDVTRERLKLITGIDLSRDVLGGV